LTGLLVQPIIGYMSDRTWSPQWGRRKPFFLIGAILSTIALFFMPHSSALWMAAGFLWILDASINISMEPFRALVADKLNEEQRSYGFVVQTLIIGIGTWIASNLPWFITKLGVTNTAEPGVIPPSVKMAFSIGAFVFLGSVLYTILTTKEYPPEDEEEFEKEKQASKGRFFSEIFENIFKMPSTMRKLGVIQFFSWFAFFTMWSLATPALTESVFHAPMPHEADFAQAADYLAANQHYQDAANSVGSYMGIYGLSSMAFALLLTLYTAKRNINRKYIHMASLILGGIGFLIMNIIPNPSWLALSFILIGISWGSILSMPYAMLSSSIDAKKMGVYMGLFNMFIVIPQIIAALGGINFTYKLIGPQAIHAMTVAGISLILAGLMNFLITDSKAISYQE
ncbi:MAG TPA: MFS transporter, partial [Saprospiraceae bacterium]|nr:MFS transporter [Saprospiraceae bacterium]